MFVKYLFAFIVVTAFLPAHGQNFVTKDAEFMDTVSETSTTCPERQVYFYNVGGKYPRSSATLLKEVQNFTDKTSYLYNGSGYVTFRFVIDCEGHMRKRVQVIQTDEKYKSYHFSKQQVNELFGFLKTLDRWKVAKPGGGEPISYIAVVSFKIQNGKVINIIP